jgi:hypothetical protein
MKMKKIVVILLAAAITVIVVRALVAPPSSVRATSFVEHWGALFEQCTTLADVKAIDQAERPDLIFVRQFKNDEWIAVRMEHSCCSGKGFDATVICDSNKRIQVDTEHTFCGYEGLSCELRRIKATSLPEFYEGLNYLKLTDWKEANKVLDATSL